MRAVIKSDGTKEEFDPQKVMRSCMRIGLGKQKCRQVLDEVLDSVEFPVRTKTLYAVVRKTIQQFGDEYPFIYGLRQSISDLSPVEFEKFSGKLLEANGYDYEWNKIIPGKAVEHQVDVVARKAGRTYMVECKLHRNPHRDSGLGVALENWARLQDIIDNPDSGYDFSRAWIMTNTKFSEHAKKYARAKGMWLTGWRYEDGRSLEAMAERTGTVPITILELGQPERMKLSRRNILTLKEFVEKGDCCVGRKNFRVLEEISIKIMKKVRSKWKSSQ